VGPAHEAWSKWRRTLSIPVTVPERRKAEACSITSASQVIFQAALFGVGGLIYVAVGLAGGIGGF